MRFSYKKILLFLLIFLFAVKTEAASPDQLNLNFSVSQIMPSGPVTFCGEKVPLEIQDVKERFERELIISVFDRAQALLWLKRSKRFMPQIEQALKENGMPDDLKYIIIAESALKPNAVSNKGAVGYWQFIQETGKNYGLTVNSSKDERRNFFTSTRAAISYLKNLYGLLGSWTLAAAAYNMGEEGLMAEMHEQENADFYKLYLPGETQRYILRIVAIKLIMQDPARYGFKLTDKDFYPPITFDSITLESSKEIPVKLIAKAAKTTFKEIKELNPEIRGYFLLKGTHTIMIPKGSADGFTERYEKLINNYFLNQGKHIYVVKKGDTLFSIAKMFDIPLLSISIWNRLDGKQKVRPGDHLIIYPRKAEPDENGL
jgi:hypothetical protein